MVNREGPLTPFQYAPYISLPVQNGDNLKGSRFRPVRNGVVRMTGKRPETEGAAGEIGAGMATGGSLSDKRTPIVDRLFYAIGDLLAVDGDVGPDVENIRFLAIGVRA